MRQLMCQALINGRKRSHPIAMAFQAPRRSTSDEGQKRRSVVEPMTSGSPLLTDIL